MSSDASFSAVPRSDMLSGEEKRREREREKEVRRKESEAPYGVYAAQET